MSVIAFWTLMLRAPLRYVVVRLVSAPIIEAAEIVDKLSMRDEKTLRMTLFSLQKFIRVRQKDLLINLRRSLKPFLVRKSNSRMNFYREMA